MTPQELADLRAYMILRVGGARIPPIIQEKVNEIYRKYPEAKKYGIFLTGPGWRVPM